MNASPGPASLPAQLNRLEQADLIRLAVTLPDLEYIFRHALIQESVYQTLLRADRRRVHQVTGEALESLLGGRVPPAELAPILARHFEEAADHRRCNCATRSRKTCGLGSTATATGPPPRLA